MLLEWLDRGLPDVMTSSDLFGLPVPAHPPSGRSPGDVPIAASVSNPGNTSQIADCEDSCSVPPGLVVCVRVRFVPLFAGVGRGVWRGV